MLHFTQNLIIACVAIIICHFLKMSKSQPSAGCSKTVNENDNNLEVTDYREVNEVANTRKNKQKKRICLKVLTLEHIEYLENVFEYSVYVSKEKCTNIANTLNVSYNVVKSWFRIRRMKEKYREYKYLNSSDNTDSSSSSRSPSPKLNSYIRSLLMIPEMISSLSSSSSDAKEREETSEECSVSDGFNQDASKPLHLPEDIYKKYINMTCKDEDSTSNQISKRVYSETLQVSNNVCGNTSLNERKRNSLSETIIKKARMSGMPQKNDDYTSGSDFDM